MAKKRQASDEALLLIKAAIEAGHFGKPLPEFRAAVGRLADYIADAEAAGRAAPPLLAACKAVLDLVEREGRDTGIGGPFSDMRDAIALAEGA